MGLEMPGRSRDLVLSASKDGPILRPWFDKLTARMVGTMKDTPPLPEEEHPPQPEKEHTPPHPELVEGWASIETLP
jgi:hypothetical protein